jgi:hypothetical protein
LVSFADVEIANFVYSSVMFIILIS